MIGQPGCEAILQKALRLSGAEATDVYLLSQESALTRFANNAIHQNVSHNNAQLHIRAVLGRRQGRATTNNLSDAGIARAVEQARDHAGLMPEDPDFPGLPTPGTPTGVVSFDEATARCTPEARARVVQEVCRRTADQGLTLAGFYRTGTHEMAVMSSQGARAHHAGSFAGLLITASSDTSAGWSKGGSWRIADIDAHALADEAIGKALRGRNPQAIEPGEYPVVLDAYAVDDLISALSAYGMGAQTVQEGRSWMNDLMGQQAVSPLVSVWDDGSDARGWPVPFDAEGVPRQRVDLIRDGVVGGPVHNSYTAAKEGRTSTGHQGSFTGGPSASNLFMGEGDGTLEEMIRSTERGLYITRFFYTRLAHAKGCAMTGMTRDGTFLIENGGLAQPVKNLRFTQSYVDALRDVETVGRESKLMLNEVGFATRVPPLKVSGFNFTGVTV